MNVSVRQFRHPEFVDQVMTLIEQSRRPPDKLKLELTESLLADDIDVTIAKMGSLKDMGVALSLDDFGIGYSSLSYLKRLPLDQLKIDREFVKDILTDANDAAIARTIIDLAHSLGLDVIAEGVETEDAARLPGAAGLPRVPGLPVLHARCRSTSWRRSWTASRSRRRPEAGRGAGQTGAICSGVVATMRGMRMTICSWVRNSSMPSASASAWTSFQSTAR